ncbi:hypothetical protein YC2023_070482 [Brassica napus]
MASFSLCPLNCSIFSSSLSSCCTELVSGLYPIFPISLSSKLQRLLISSKPSEELSPATKLKTFPFSSIQEHPASFLKLISFILCLTFLTSSHFPDPAYKLESRT